MLLVVCIAIRPREFFDIVTSTLIVTAKVDSAVLVSLFSQALTGHGSIFRPIPYVPDWLKRRDVTIAW